MFEFLKSKQFHIAFSFL